VGTKAIIPTIFRDWDIERELNSWAISLYLSQSIYVKNWLAGLLIQSWLKAVLS